MISFESTFEKCGDPSRNIISVKIRVIDRSINHHIINVQIYYNYRINTYYYLANIYKIPLKKDVTFHFVTSFSFTL